MHSVHLDGTRTVLSALDRHSRLVHTSSLVVLGATRTGQLVDEAHPQPAPFAFAYAEAKRASEHLACAAACAGREVVITNPAYLLGPEDYERSVMGQLCERFWRGKIPVAPPGGWNVVDVRDVATGHLLAAERGQVGERYVLGGQNLRCIDVFQHLAQVAGFGRHTLPQLPQWLYRLIARGSELYGWLVGKEPYPNRTQAELNRYFWYCHSQKAQAELGYTPRPLTRTVADTFAWYRQRGLRLPRGWRRWWLRAA
jgi:dihydroflavonol-4-reductase